MLSRRQFVLTSFAALAAPSLLPRGACAVAPRRQFADVPLVSTRLRDGVWAITERGGNSLLISSGQGPVLVDTKISTAARLLADQAKEVGGAAPTMIINTHHHFDHSGGNFAFDDAAEIVAHKNLNPRMQANLDQIVKPALASEINALRNSGKDAEAAAMAQWVDRLTVDDIKADHEFADTLELDRGDVKITLRHFGHGHTDNDTVVFLAGANVIHMGDLFFHKMHPYIDRPAGATTVGWRTSVRKAMDLCDDNTVVVPGHGEVTNKTGLATQVAYFDQLQQIVEAAIKEGKTREAIGKLEPDQFNGLGFPQLREQALTAMYEELTTAKQP